MSPTTSSAKLAKPERRIARHFMHITKYLSGQLMLPQETDPGTSDETASDPTKKEVLSRNVWACQCSLYSPAT